VSRTLTHRLQVPLDYAFPKRPRGGDRGRKPSLPPLTDAQKAMADLPGTEAVVHRVAKLRSRRLAWMFDDILWAAYGGVVRACRACTDPATWEPFLFRCCWLAVSDYIRAQVPLGYRSRGRAREPHPATGTIEFVIADGEVPLTVGQCVVARGGGRDFEFEDLLDGLCRTVKGGEIVRDYLGADDPTLDQVAARHGCSPSYVSLLYTRALAVWRGRMEREKV
jgi:hypothetical protein